MTPLDAREWLEHVVRVDPKVNGDHARAALSAMDEAEGVLAAEQCAQATLDEVTAVLPDLPPNQTIVAEVERMAKQLDDLAELTGCLDDTLVPLLTERNDAWFDVCERMRGLGYVGPDASTDEILSALWLFLPEVG